MMAPEPLALLESAEPAALLQLQPVVLCGGSGTRLWPLSRSQYPKQLLPIGSEDSLLQATLRRTNGMEESAGPLARQVHVLPPLVVCNEAHRFLVAEQLRTMGSRGQLILEPVGRNTAPALALAAHAALSLPESDPVLLVMPADHVIADTPAFQALVLQGAELARQGAVVTFGVVPTAPETGYGYIEQGEPFPESLHRAPSGNARSIRGFVEKPDLATAKAYLQGGRHVWNSGLFMVLASVWLDTLAHCRPDIAKACHAAWADAHTEAPFVHVNEAAFTACPADSIDFAVMERIAGAPWPPSVVLPLPGAWSDVGAWEALWQLLPHDAQGNVLQGDVLVHDVHNTLAFAERRLVACVGVRDLIVVETADAVLVVHKDHSQDVKAIVGKLERAGRKEGQTHRKVARPWGWYDSVDTGLRFQVKRILVNPGASLSLQMHHHRAEHWIVVTGTARVTRGDDVFLLSENESTYIPLGVRHRLENPGCVALEMIEVQSGSYLGEDDIVRFGDHYGRV